MGREVERKFLVRGDAWRSADPGTAYRQGYLSREKGCVVRVRLAGEQATLSVKAALTDLTRLEYEYPIPLRDAVEMLDGLCERPLIEKTRHRVTWNGLLWEIDEFSGENAGLIVAEVELQGEDQALDLPDWVGQEVSYDPRYLNVNLGTCPYRLWQGG